MERLTFRQFQIFEYLFDKDGYITSKEISDAFNISVRTVKSEISEINSIIEDAGCIVDSKSSKGYTITYFDDYDDSLLKSKFPNKCDIHNSIIPKTYHERVIYIIKKLLVVDYHIKIEDLCDEIYVSRASMATIMKEVRSRLLNFRLDLVSSPGYGVIIEGTEIDKRMAVAEYFFHDSENNKYELISNEMFANEDSVRDYEQLEEIIKTVISSYNIEMSDFSIHNLIVHLNILIHRCMLYNFVKVSEDIISEWQNRIEFKAAFQIISQIEGLYNFMMPIGESVYVAQHIRSKRIIDNNILSVEQEEKLKNCLNIIVEEIDDNFGLNLKNDDQWYGYMYLHIPLMLERLKTHMTIRNPLTKDNMRRYLFAAKVTHSACEVIKQFYDVDIDKNEFGYLLLYFNLAIIKFELNKPLNVAILSGRGRPESVMIANEIKERFSSRKYNINEVTSIDKDYDLIISTYNTNLSVNCPVLTTNTDNYLDNIAEMLNNIRYKNLDLDIFFKEEYCTFDLDGETWEEVENNLHEELTKKDLFKSIINADSHLMIDELGNGIIHMQDSYRILKKNMCYFCLLKKSVYYDRDPIRVIIITKTKRDHDKDLYNLCRIISKWANDKQKVNNLVKNKDYKELIKDLRSLL